MDEHIVIYYDDLTDSDNWATARFLQHAALKNPSIHVIWIVEPRQVSLGLSMTFAQITECKNLLKSHFSSRGDPFKLLLGGLLQQSDIDDLDGLTEHERDLLSFAVKPKYGPKDDAILHGRLMAWDLSVSLNKWSNKPVEVFLDVDTLDSLEDPVNLYVHYHEELLARTQRELKRYETIMDQPYLQRVEYLRRWYRRCIRLVENKAVKNASKVSNLDVESLCRRLDKAKSVKFFGGSSLGLLQRLMERHDVGNMECYLQVGAFDLSKNLFPNQFNIALNIPAARFVLDNFRKFSRFLIIPTDTAKRISYSLIGLCFNVPPSTLGKSLEKSIEKSLEKSLEKRFLGFNCHEDPMKLVTEEVVLDQSTDRACIMSDLTALLCAFWGRFRGSKSTFAQLTEKNGQLALEHGKSGGIPVYEIHENVTLGKSEIINILSELEVDSPVGIATNIAGL